MAVRNRSLLRRYLLYAVFAALGIALSACSFSGNESRTPPPPIAKSKAAFGPQLPPAEEKAEPSAMEVFKALAPPEGMKFTPLFAESLGSTDARVNRLENAVQNIKNDFDTIMPAMVRMVAIEKDIRELVSQLQTLTDGPALLPVPTEREELPAPETHSGTQGRSASSSIPGGDVVGGTETAAAHEAAAGPMTPSSLVTPEAAPKGELPPEGAASPSSSMPVELIPQAPAPRIVAADMTGPALPSAGRVVAVRIGDHGDKTRIVFDMTAKAVFTATMGANGKSLTVDLPQMEWKPPQVWEAESAALIAGYKVEARRVTFEVLYPSTIKMHRVLDPEGSGDYHKLVIDLFSPDVHQ